MDDPLPSRIDGTHSWGLVLSGGAAWGLTNAGVLRTLEAAGLTPPMIAGSSMGAIIAAVYALGHPSAVFEQLAKKIRWWNIARLAKHPLRGGLHGGILQQNLQVFLQPLLQDATIADCTIPLVCVAGRVEKPIDWKRITQETFTDELLDAVQVHVFEPTTRLIDAVMASSAVPVVFAPYRIGSCEYVDLVHFGAIPARTLRAQCHPDVIIATNTNPPHDMLARYAPTGWRMFLERGYETLNASLDACDIVLTPRMPAAPWRFDRARQFIAAGAQAATEKLPDIQKSIDIVE